MNIIYQGRTKKIEKGLTVKEALKKEINENKYEVIGCLYNNDYRNLETEVEEGARIELIDISSKEGMKIYVRTIVYIMGKAFENLYNREKIMVEYQLGNAMYCKCDNIQITDEFITKLKNEMQKIIESFQRSFQQPKSFFPKQIPVVLSFVLFLPYYFSAVFSISIFNSSTDIPALLAASSIDKIPSFTKPDKILTVASLLPSSIISSTA